jgi:hypothetical protein
MVKFFKSRNNLRTPLHVTPLFGVTMRGRGRVVRSEKGDVFWIREGSISYPLQIVGIFRIIE